MMGNLPVERRAKFDVYFIFKKNAYNERDGTGQTQ
jgi:hypothetical protein